MIMCIRFSGYCVTQRISVHFPNDLVMENALFYVPLNTFEKIFRTFRSHNTALRLVSGTRHQFNELILVQNTANLPDWNPFSGYTWLKEKKNPMALLIEIQSAFFF